MQLETCLLLARCLDCRICMMHRLMSTLWRGSKASQPARRSASCGKHDFRACAEALGKLLLCACKQRQQKPLFDQLQLTCTRGVCHLQSSPRGRRLPSRSRVSVPNCFRVRVCSQATSRVCVFEFAGVHQGSGSCRTPILARACCSVLTICIRSIQGFVLFAHVFTLT